ncbi:hypothetical protein Glove_209g90 [Diversispora epigaea]|uniref:Uncharacterized protein n=1 Tax=Diversispora epigaea TaxID=1348612 RepID=A0A397IRT3_9GLOM|nr:hypothetical protein Glove_209g90 [Diversispora epigaea]
MFSVTAGMTFHYKSVKHGITFCLINLIFIVSWKKIIHSIQVLCEQIYCSSVEKAIYFELNIAFIFSVVFMVLYCILVRLLCKRGHWRIT